MTRRERKEMKMVMAKKMEKAFTLGRIYLSDEGLEKVLKATQSK